MRLFLLASITLAAALAAPSAVALPGDLDPSFGVNGVRKAAAAGGSWEFVGALGLASDGKYLVGGLVYGIGTYVARFDADGTPDSGFGTGGHWIAPASAGIGFVAGRPDLGVVAGGSDQRKVVLYRLGSSGVLEGTSSVDPGPCPSMERHLCNVEVVAGMRDPVQGRYWLGGSVSDLDSVTGLNVANDFMVVRFNEDGTVDNSFAAGGFARYDIGGDDRFTAMIPQPDGGAMLVGTTSSNNGPNGVSILRIKADGALDAAFGQGGRVVIGASLIDNSVAGIVPQPDGFLVASAFGTVVKIGLDGAIDASFGTGGHVTGLGPFYARVFRALNGDASRLLLAGDSPDGFALQVIFSNGQVDSSFANPGSTGFLGPNALPVDAIPRDDGRFLVGGKAKPVPFGNDIELARYLPDGKLDGTFGNGGRVIHDFGLKQSADGVAVGVQSHGRIVAGGQVLSGSARGFFLAGFDEDGSADPTFGSDGKSVLSAPDVEAYTSEMRILPDDSIVMGAETRTGPWGMPGYALGRFRSDGSVDGSFGTGGMAALADGCAGLNDCRIVFDVVPDGGLVVAVLSVPSLSDVGDVTIHRLDRFGRLVTTFGTNGVVRFDAGDQERPLAIFVNADGSILLVAGKGPAGNAAYQVILARFLADGSVDTSFGVAGRISTEVVVSLARVIREPSGALVMASSKSVLRMMPDGTLDPGFGSGGRAEFPLAILYGIVRAGDGRYYVLGYEGLAPTVLRFTPNGRIDKRYGTGGIARPPASIGLPFGIASLPAGGLAFTGSEDTEGGYPPTRNRSMIVGRLLGGDRPPNDFAGAGTDGVVFSPTMLAGPMTLRYGSSTVSLGTRNVDELAPVIADLDGDGRAEFLRQRASGTTVTRLSFDANLAITTTAVAPPATGWHVTHAGDLDGDGKDDLAWADSSGNGLRLTLMDGSATTSSASLDWPGWHLDALADMDGDGRADLVISHDSGYLAVVLMRGLQPVAIGVVLGAGTGWHFVAANDLDGDGKADLVVAHTDGTMVALRMSGVSAVGGWPIAAPEHGASYHGVTELVPGGQFLVIRRGNASWHLVGAGLYAGLDFEIFGAGSPWSITHVKDLDGDGLGDLVMRYTDGTVGAWLSTQQFVVLKGPGPEVIVP